MIEAGERIGKFVITRHLGAGGMGTVYEARDPELSRAVAIKLVLDRGADPVRLLREAQALARISHPNVVAVYELGSHGDDVFVAMELVDGVTIDRYIAANGCDWRAVLALYVQAGRGLCAVHEQEIIHRDIKPSNILVDNEGRVRVGDFGLARTETADSSEAITRDGRVQSQSVATQDGSTASSIDSQPKASSGLAALDAPITVRGAAVGTPRYMAPEQGSGGRVTRSVDQYAFAVALWEAIYGELPGDRREAPEGAKAPIWIERALARALNTEPAARWPSMIALLHELERAPQRRARRVVATGATLFVGGTLAAFIGFGAFASGNVNCERAGDPVVAAWSTAARVRTTTALGNVGAGWTAPAESVAIALDRWTARSREVRIDACRATHDRGSQTAALLDRRVTCLDGQQAVFGALVRVFAVADRSTAEHALDAAERLPAPETCTATRFIDAIPSARAADLADATVAVDLQRPDARATIEKLVATSGEADPGFRSRVHLLHGRTLAATDPRTARAELDDALTDAAAARDPGLEAEVALATLVIAATFESVDRIDALLPTVRAAVTRAGEPRPLAAALARVESEAYMRLGRAEPARSACSRVTSLAEPSRVALDTARCACKLALIVRDRAAAEACEQELVQTRTAFGATHPRTADVAHNWITALVRVGRAKEAEAAARANVALLTSLYGRDSAHVVVALQLLSVTQDRLDQLAASRGTLEEALAISDRVLGLDSPGRAGLLMELADRALAQKDRAAIQLADSGLAASERLLGPEHSDLAVALITHAKAIALDPAQIPRSIESWRRGIALAEKNAGPQSLVLASILSSYAYFLATHDRSQEALEPAKRSVPIFEVIGESVSAARTEGLIGEIYIDLKKPAEARPWFVKSRARFATLGDGYQDELANAERLLATAK